MFILGFLLSAVIFMIGYTLGRLARVEQSPPQNIRDIIKATGIQKDEVQFLEPITAKEKFENAKNISDLIN